MTGSKIKEEILEHVPHFNMMLKERRIGNVAAVSGGNS